MVVGADIDPCRKKVDLLEVTADPSLFSIGQDGMPSFDQLSFWEYLAGDDEERGTEDDRYFSDTGQVPESISAAIPGVSVSNSILDRMVFLMTFSMSGCRCSGSKITGETPTTISGNNCSQRNNTAKLLL